MGRPVFKSGFAAEINAYIDYKVASGYKENSFYFILHDFDHFCMRQYSWWMEIVIEEENSKQLQ